MASFGRQFRYIFFYNPEILVEKSGKSGRVGGSAIWLVAVLLSMFFRRMQAPSQGLWLLCVEMGVAC